MSPSLCSLFFAFSFLQAGWMDGVVFYVSDLDTEFTLGNGKQSELFTDLITRTMMPLVTLMIMTMQLWQLLLKMRTMMGLMMIILMTVMLSSEKKIYNLYISSKTFYFYC